MENLREVLELIRGSTDQRWGKTDEEKLLKALREYKKKGKKNLANSLKVFINSPAPCKMTIIRFLEAILED